MAETSDSFRPALPVATTMNTAVHSQMEWDQGGLFQVSVSCCCCSLFMKHLLSESLLLTSSSFSPASSLEGGVSGGGESQRPPVESLHLS